MTTKDMKKIIEHQVKLSLQERHMNKNDIGLKQFKDECYEMAVKMLVEL